MGQWTCTKEKAVVKVPEKKLKMTARNTQDTVTKSRLTSHVVAIRVGMLSDLSQCGCVLGAGCVYRRALGKN